jgi:hypothetical protein
MIDQYANPHPNSSPEPPCQTSLTVWHNGTAFDIEGGLSCMVNGEISLQRTVSADETRDKLFYLQCKNPPLLPLR